MKFQGQVPYCGPYPSPPSRGAWIEMLGIEKPKEGPGGGAPPPGGGGFNINTPAQALTAARSPPSRGAWIEIK